MSISERLPRAAAALLAAARPGLRLGIVDLSALEILAASSYLCSTEQLVFKEVDVSGVLALGTQ